MGPGFYGVDDVRAFVDGSIVAPCQLQWDNASLAWMTQEQSTKNQELPVASMGPRFCLVPSAVQVTEPVVRP